MGATHVPAMGGVDVAQMVDCSGDLWAKGSLRICIHETQLWKGLCIEQFLLQMSPNIPWYLSDILLPDAKMLYSIFPTTYNTASWPPNWVRVLPSIFHISLVESSSRVNPETQRGVSCFCCPQARCHVLTAVATAQRSSQYMDTKASWGKEQSVVSETTKRRKCKLCFKSNTFQKSLGCEV